MVARQADTLDYKRRDWRLITGEKPCPFIEVHGAFVLVCIDWYISIYQSLYLSFYLYLFIIYLSFFLYVFRRIKGCFFSDKFSILTFLYRALPNFLVFMKVPVSTLSSGMAIMLPLLMTTPTPMRLRLLWIDGVHFLSRYVGDYVQLAIVNTFI